MTTWVMESRLKINAILAMINFHSGFHCQYMYCIVELSPSELCRRGMLLAIVHV